jgi:hypothetical protein
VSENKGFGKIFRPQKAEENEQFRILYNEELHELYRLPSIFKIVKFRGPQWAGHMARMREIYRILVGLILGK